MDLQNIILLVAEIVFMMGMIVGSIVLIVKTSRYNKQLDAEKTRMEQEKIRELLRNE